MNRLIRSTNLDISRFFERELPRVEKVFRVLVHTSIGSIVVELNTITFGAKSFWPHNDMEYDYQWTPKTHMRDYEDIRDASTRELIVSIQKGFGICVIIIDPVIYVKLVHSATIKGAIEIQYMHWNRHSTNTEALLSGDLDNGYDVLMYFDGEWVKMCEEKDERDYPIAMEA